MAPDYPASTSISIMHVALKTWTILILCFPMSFSFATMFLVHVTDVIVSDIDEATMPQGMHRSASQLVFVRTAGFRLRGGQIKANRAAHRR